MRLKPKEQQFIVLLARAYENNERVLTQDVLQKLSISRKECDQIFTALWTDKKEQMIFGLSQDQEQIFPERRCLELAREIQVRQSVAATPRARVEAWIEAHRATAWVKPVVDFAGPIVGLIGGILGIVGFIISLAGR